MPPDPDTNPDIVPRPDPTRLTTEQSRALQEQLRREIAFVRETIETRIDAFDRAAVILAENVNRVPTVLDREISRLKELFIEKFEGIKEQFSERDVRQAAAEEAAKTAVNAALAAQKDSAAATFSNITLAMNKGEVNTTKEIDSLKRLFETSVSNLSARIDEVKSRLDRGEGGVGGARSQAEDVRQAVAARASANSNTIAVAAIVAVIMLGILQVGMGILTHNAALSAGPQVPLTAPIQTAPR